MVITPASLVRDPLWFAHRYDPGNDAFQFRRIDRAAHDRATFLTDEYLGVDTPTVVRRDQARAAVVEQAPLHFIFHSAFCCSTLLARAFDSPGVAMGLKEPVLFNDLSGWQQRGGSARQIAAVLDDGLALLARPFGPGEAVVVKPSNLVNGMAPAILTMRPGTRALLLYAPLRVFLGSVARKGMDGRLWVRDLLVKQLREGLHPFGFKGEDYLGQTDLQVAAMGWLAQHALFARLAAQFPGRVASLDSERLLADPAAALTRLSALFGVALDVPAVMAGPVFTHHSKFGGEFTAEDRRAVQAEEAAHADEIEKVTVWTEAVAKAAGVPMILPAPLLG